jgi:hypothetical protein
MRKLATAAAVVAAALASAGSVWAAAPEKAGGSIAELGQVATESHHVRGEDATMTVDRRTITGSFDGLLSIEQWTYPRPGDYREIEATEACICTVDGRSGIALFEVKGGGEGDGPDVLTVHVRGMWGGLLGLHGKLLVVGGTYTGEYHFDRS